VARADVETTRIDFALVEGGIEADAANAEQPPRVRGRGNKSGSRAATQPAHPAKARSGRGSGAERGK
jgi:hypothetical protein